MSRDHLETASDLLEQAATETTGDSAADRLADLSDQLGRLAAGETDPDHGRLARIQRSLDDIGDSVDDTVVDALDDADAEINAFRETLEGV
ncbi:MAG: hypothetical protein V5A55_05970 [Halovenus sp.]